MSENNFQEWFKHITGWGSAPYDFQERFATQDPLPRLVEVPTGCGKTAMILLGWLWRRVACGEAKIKNDTPRRLVYCLPMRTLVEQTFHEAEQLAAKINDEYGREIKVHKLMGGEAIGEWDIYPESEAILIGTQDMLISRALNRGYAVSRFRWPLDFSLLNNDCLWVMDEVQLMGVGLATSAQLTAFRKQFQTFGGSHTVWMSATLEQKWLQTVDFKHELDSVELLKLSDKDREQIQRQLNAPKILKKFDKSRQAGKEEEKFNEKLAAFVKEKHQEGTQTLVIVNTVDRAQELYKKLKNQLGIKKDEQDERLMLIHSRFRPEEREALNEKLKEWPQSGRILVATQVVEAGVDISSKCMITELAPWSSLVQRFGRCNRKGEHEEAEIYWIDLADLDKTGMPYEKDELKQAQKNLKHFKNQSVSPQEIENAGFPAGEYQPKHVIRRKDMIELFDTTPDLTGADIDISRFVRDEEENREVQVFWREWDQPKGFESPPTEKTWRKAKRDELCSVPIGRFIEFVKNRENQIWRWDFLSEKWGRVDKNTVYPGQIYLVHKNSGGYNIEFGWQGKDEKTPVSLLPPTISEDEDLTDYVYGGDNLSQTEQWQTIAQHTDDVVNELKCILDALSVLLEPNPLDENLADTLEQTARWHDRGKAHPSFQAKLKPEAVQQANLNGALVAKAPDEAWVKGKNTNDDYRPYFRHELASALAMLQQGFPNLAVYLAAAHHGKVRLSIRSMPNEQKPKDNPNALFARGVWDGDELPEVDLGDGEKAPPVTLSLECMQLGRSPNGDPSWMERMLNLRDQWGPFRLAYLEALLRAADMRASKSVNKSKNKES